jgi:hypothetical protein
MAGTTAVGFPDCPQGFSSFRFSTLPLRIVHPPILIEATPAISIPLRSSDGKGWKLNQATIQDSKRRRVLLIGDSILSGYTAQVICGSARGLDHSRIDLAFQAHVCRPQEF